MHGRKRARHASRAASMPVAAWSGTTTLNSPSRRRTCVPHEFRRESSGSSGLSWSSLSGTACFRWSTSGINSRVLEPGVTAPAVVRYGCGRGRGAAEPVAGGAQSIAAGRSARLACLRDARTDELSRQLGGAPHGLGGHPLSPRRDRRAGAGAHSLVAAAADSGPVRGRRRWQAGRGGAVAAGSGCPHGRTVGDGVLAAAVVALFEDTIARFTALAVLLPVVAGQSGNTGAQAMAVTMRGLALREFRPRGWFPVVRKELVAGLINGVAVALIACAVAYLWHGTYDLALVLGPAMIFSMTMAGMTGALIPIVLTALGRDPAQSASIVLTTVTDVMGFLSFSRAGVPAGRRIRRHLAVNRSRLSSLARLTSARRCRRPSASCAAPR